MASFDRMTWFDAVSAEAVQQTIAHELSTSAQLALSGQGRALARIEQRLHIFQWSSNEQQTRLRYWVCNDVPGELDVIAEYRSTFDAPPAALTEFERADAEARLKRIRAAVGMIEPKATRSTEPAPIGMRGVFLWTVFFGVAGVLVTALNWRRMNRRELFGPTVLLGAVAYPVFELAVRVLVNVWTGSALVVALAYIVHAAVWGALLVRWQRPTFDRWVQTNGRPARADQRAGCSFVYRLLFVSFVISAITGFGYLTLTGTSFNDNVAEVSTGQPKTSFVATSQPKTIFATGIRMWVPANWVLVTSQEQKGIGCIDGGRQTCILAIKRDDGAAFVGVIRISDVALHDSMAATEQMLVSNFMKRDAALRVDAPRQTKVDNHRAVQRVMQVSDEHATIHLYFIQESTNSYLYVLAYMPEGDAITQGEIARMIASLHIDAEYAD